MIGWRYLRRLVYGKRCRVWIRNRQELQYYENGRIMTIAGEMLLDGFSVCVASIVTWDDSDGELIDQAERQRILGNVKSCLESMGANVELA